MEPRDIQQILNGYVEEAIHTDLGAHRYGLVDRLLHEHPGIADYGDRLLRNALLGMADKAMKPKRSETQQLPGMGDPVGTTVTVRDGEGSFAIKALDRATVEDLQVDLDIHRVNIDAAIRAHKLADRRNRRLIPIMEERGFGTAGEALRWLAQGEAA